MKEETKHEIFSWLKTFAFAFVLAFCINNFVIVNATVPSPSMNDTIMVEDRLVAFRFSYLLSEPERFDIIVFYAPDEKEKMYVKRVLGLPGETLEIKDGKVYIDESEIPLEDNFIKEDFLWGDFGPYEIPEDSYFMMGDNRNDSLDSRFWENTYVHKDAIIGKAIFKYYPGLKILR